MTDIADLPPAFELSDDVIVQSIKSIIQKEKFAKSTSLGSDDLTQLQDITNQLVALVNQNFNPSAFDLEKFNFDFERLPSLYQKNYNDIKKKDIDKFPPFFQLLLLLEYLHTIKHPDYLIKIHWLMIAILLAVRFEARGLSSYYKKVILRFKLAVFSPSDTYSWVWQYLTDGFFEQIQQVETPCYVLTFAETLNKIATDYIDDVLQPVVIKQRVKRAKQLSTIATLIEVAFYPKRKRKAEAREKEREREQHQQAQAITQEEKQLREQNRIQSLAQQVIQQPFYEDVRYSYYPIKSNQDIEAYQPPIKQQYFLPQLIRSSQSFENDLPITIEEQLDNIEAPVITYDKSPDVSIRYSVPLQQTELSVQQLYLSKRDFRFSMDTRLLSAIAYRLVFARLLFDALQDDPSFDTEKRCASLLLFSLITAMPVQTLIQPHFIRTCSLFDIKKTQATLVSQLGITKRQIEQVHLMFENNSDWVKLPLPVWLVQFLLPPRNLPTLIDINEYLARLRQQIGLPYLSIHRIETALEAVLTRHIEGSNSHISALICRTPAVDAPAIFYSSHSNSELVAHYQNALAWLDSDSKLDLSYFARRTDNVTGSGFALTLQSVQWLMKELKWWVLDADNAVILFNRFSAYSWLVLCVLTGIRPNNALGNIREIDTDMGWLQVCDKPNKDVKNHRLVPLCDSLIEHLEVYQRFLANFRLKTLNKPRISRTLQLIHTQEVDVTLLNFVNETYDNLVAIRRGDIYRLTQEFVNMNPYWCRHFVRTQLEKRKTPMHLINSVIGHEKNNQEALGEYSSASNQDIHSVSQPLQDLAIELGLNAQHDWFTQVQQQLNHL